MKVCACYVSRPQDLPQPKDEAGPGSDPDKEN